MLERSASQSQSTIQTEFQTKEEIMALIDWQAKRVFVHENENEEDCNRRTLLAHCKSTLTTCDEEQVRVDRLAR
jgi:hypothetical protein